MVVAHPLFNFCFANGCKKDVPKSGDNLETAPKQMFGFILYRVNPNICLGSVQNVDPVS